MIDEKIELPTEATLEEIQKIIQSKFDDCLFKVSTEHTRIPEKIKRVLGESENLEIRNALQSYFDMRNGIEHHKGIAKTDRVVTYKRLALVSSSGVEIVLNQPLDGNILVTALSEEIVYDQGGSIVINRIQLDGIVSSILLFVIPTIEQRLIAGLTKG